MTTPNSVHFTDAELIQETTLQLRQLSPGWSNTSTSGQPRISHSSGLNVELDGEEHGSALVLRFGDDPHAYGQPRAFATQHGCTLGEGAQDLIRELLNMLAEEVMAIPVRHPKAYRPGENGRTVGKAAAKQLGPSWRLFDHPNGPDAFQLNHASGHAVLVGTGDTLTFRVDFGSTGPGSAEAAPLREVVPEATESAKATGRRLAAAITDALVDELVAVHSNYEQFEDFKASLRGLLR
ncbi:hypothetical protein [Kitasatospora sp. NPDC090091]|uniref:hypothetical protein n=1 Tax=Kitasatospora sp. NPDC090091 TaxID=3364081 RepID=UPI0037F5332B